MVSSRTVIERSSLPRGKVVGVRIFRQEQPAGICRHPVGISVQNVGIASSGMSAFRRGYVGKVEGRQGFVC